MTTTPAAPAPDTAAAADVLERNHVQVLGTGPTVVFAHGFGCDQNMWRFVAPAFVPDHRVVLFDYVGAGRSRRAAYDPARYATLDGYAQDLLDVCHAVGARDVRFVGHSVSAMIGLLAAIREPELFERLVLVGPSPCYLNDPPHYRGGFERADIDALLELMDRNYIGWANHLAPVVMRNAERPELADELEASFCTTDPVAARQFAAVTFRSDNRADLPRVTVPSLVLQCSDDAIAPMSVGAYLAEHLPRSELRVLQAEGHCPHMSHPLATIAQIRAFFAAPLPQ